MATSITVDVEDWYDGMAQLGHPVRSPSPGSGLGALRRLLSSEGGSEPARLTLFVVGKYAPQVAGDLRALAGDGHELASHGPDHGRLPENAGRLEAWLREGRERVEDVVQRGIVGFRSPCFAMPASMSLARYREVLARAGFEYVSDRHRLGSSSPLPELPVLQWRGIPVGGGSYQRLLPTKAVTAVVQRLDSGCCVLYYHSYDFGHVLPRLRDDHSPAVLRYAAGRGRVPPIVAALLSARGSISCKEAAGAV